MPHTTSDLIGYQRYPILQEGLNRDALWEGCALTWRVTAARS